MAIPSSWATDLVVQTFEAWTPEIADNIMTGTPFMAFMLKEGRVEFRGGKSINCAVRYKKNSNLGFYSKASTLGTTDDEITTAAVYNWAHHYANIPVADTDLSLNMGDNEIHNILTTAKKATERDVANSMNDALIHNSTAIREQGSLTPKAYYFNGLGHLIGNTETISVGGITPNNTGTDSRFWKSHVATDRANDYDYDGLREDTDGIIQEVEEYRAFSPNLILTTKEVYRKFASSAWDKTRIEQAGDVDFRFRNIMFGDAMVLYDNVPAPTGHKNRIYIVNTDTLQFVINSNDWMTIKGPIRLPSKPYDYFQYFSTANLVCDNRRANAVWDQASS